MKGKKTAILALLLAGMVATFPGKVWATDPAAEQPSTEAAPNDSNTPDEIATPTYSAGGSAYVTIGDTYVTQTVSAGQQVTLVIPIVNYAYFPITDIVVTPQVTNLAATWPFKPETTGYTKHVGYIAPYGDGVDVNAQRADVVFNFTVRPDAYTGYYPLNFHLTYIVNENIESTDITAYINVKGAPGSGTLEEKAKESVSKPRMIVTGFETTPERITAGETFTATVHVQNTSSSTVIRNALFNLQADPETVGSGNSATTYSAFLPTSGSSSIYKDKIGAGETVDLTIEMTARADLAEKPYVMEVKMTYDAGDNADLTDTASVSIPIYQEARFDTGEEAMGETYTTVGSENSLSFSIYNTGRTTLNNVWFRIKDDCVEGDDVFVGTIEPGNTGYVDSTFTATAANSDGKMHGVIEYEDDAGNVTSVDKEYELEITEFNEEDYMMDESEMYVEEEPQGLPGWAIILIIVGAAVVVLIIILVCVSSARKKKAAKMEEDLVDEELEELAKEETDKEKTDSEDK